MYVLYWGYPLYKHVRVLPPIAACLPLSRRIDPPSKIIEPRIPPISISMQCNAMAMQCNAVSTILCTYYAHYAPPPIPCVHPPKAIQRLEDKTRCVASYRVASRLQSCLALKMVRQNLEQVDSFETLSLTHSPSNQIESNIRNS